jgi:hypothetical protein
VAAGQVDRHPADAVVEADARRRELHAGRGVGQVDGDDAGVGVPAAVAAERSDDRRDRDVGDAVDEDRHRAVELAAVVAHDARALDQPVAHVGGGIDHDPADAGREGQALGVGS